MGSTTLLKSLQYKLHYLERLDAYQEQMGPVVDNYFQQDGQQPGDPDKAAAAIVSVVRSERPPLHFVLGSDAATMIRTHLDDAQAELAHWQATSRSTDF